jgi:uncharacterized protein
VIAAVFDSNVVVSGLMWRGESYLCLVAQARRLVRVFSSAWILEEVRLRLRELEQENKQMRPNPWPAFGWFSCSARIVEPAPMGKQRSRDADDDPILGTALAARATTIVTKDRDLLEMGKPYGLEIFRPGDFLRKVNR